MTSPRHLGGGPGTSSNQYSDDKSAFSLTIDDGLLKTFGEMWYKIFIAAFLSSVFVHTVAALISFATLHKHKYGKFFPIVIVIMGIIQPLTSFVVSSAVIAFVYRASSLPMPSLNAVFWGIGQTALAACIGFTRILATL